MLKRVLGVFFGNIRLKLWALLISVGIWFYASSQITEETTARAALNITAPSGYAVVYESDDAARVTIAGPRSLLDRMRGDLAQNHIQLSYNMTDKEAAAGWATLRIGAEWLRPRIPEEEYVQLSLREVSPAAVRVFVSPVRERTLPVSVRTSGAPPAGFRLADTPTCSPSQVKVRGPAIAVDAMKSVETAELALYNVQGSVDKPLSLESEVQVTLDNGVTASVPVSPNPAIVTASVQIVGEEERTQTIENVPVLLLASPGFPYAAEFAQGEDTVSVVVRASPTNLRKLRPESVKAYVDLGKLGQERIEPGGSAPYKEKVQVSLPEEVTYSMTAARPDRVTLLLKNPAK